MVDSAVSRQIGGGKGERPCFVEQNGILLGNLTNCPTLVDRWGCFLVICQVTTYSGVTYRIEDIKGFGHKGLCMDVNEHLPLQEATFFILLSLAQTPKHGYAILVDVADLSDGRLELSTGTLYGGLRRLLDQGWIERYEAASEVVNGRERKAYRITDLGQKILNADLARMQSLISVAQMKLA